MIRRIAIWLVRISLGLIGFLVLGFIGLNAFPLGCPVSKHLPATVSDVTCDKDSNFPVLKYEITATATKAEYDAFVETLQQEVEGADWTFKTWDNRVSVSYSNTTIIGWVGWSNGRLQATWRQF